MQRKCACGSPTSSLTGSCPECGSKKRLQTKLSIGASNDPLEQEADRVADQVLATPVRSAVAGAPARIQRFTGRVTGDAGLAPASVDQALASSGSPLEPALRQDMEQRFGHDFSQVRVHSDAAAARSALDVNAQAYTVGHDIVFAAGRFAPRANEGRRLLAHELTHVVQQGAMGQALQRQKSQQRKRPGSINGPVYEKKVLDTHIWPSALASIGWLKGTPIGSEVWDALIQAGAVVTIKFVAERSDIPVGGLAVEGFCDILGNDNFDVYVLAGQQSFYAQPTQHGSTVIMPRTVARPADETADTLFHEMLHAWFHTLYPNASIPSGHTRNALGMTDPKFDPKQYDPVFLDRLKRFTKELQKLKVTKSNSRPKATP